MAQLAIPGLSDFKLALDGKAMDLPAGIIPTEVGLSLIHISEPTRPY